MAIDSRYRMSQERLDTLKEELHYLETTREKEVAELIKEARSFGDLSENSEYDEAKTEQGKLYSRIAELNDLIENADVVEKVEVAADVVTIGSRVRVLDVDEDVEEEYTIVGSQEANPMDGRISDDSPFGFALKGHKVGETYGDHEHNDQKDTGFGELHGVTFFKTEMQILYTTGLEM